MVVVGLVMMVVEGVEVVIAVLNLARNDIVWLIALVYHITVDGVVGVCGGVVVRVCGNNDG